ncbi:hypothetical protein SAMN02745146_0725 [Hymenobacter daecheongensis DSM 21074]|uniref:GAD-related domain-containing protein n=1 Tax=Hymenobacter daecheongensis DSM 21074 TaxID=1121955 RepID=A0A1M6AQE0_9BACT|nr:hypothetical protein [Hymenobacter daecheongensis]SHI38617.1 hypothetical protein SAMN02745146_0725 [Hymenobacter daecheongensis DSM 21074]
MSTEPEISIFTHHFGRPAPAVPPGDFFADKFDKSLWRMMYDEVGAGWYRNGFLYLFGADLPLLNPALAAWAGLLEPEVERTVIGRNAYGMLLVAEQTTDEGTDAPIGLLDPATGVYAKQEGLDFASLLSDWLPEDRLPGFLDQAAYDAFVSGGGQLAAHEVLTAQAAGPGPEDVLAYHMRMAQAHQK